MKATLKNSDVQLNTEYLNSVRGSYSYFYVPVDMMSADVFRAVSDEGPITAVSKYGNDQWQVEVKTDAIEWED